MPDLVYQLLVSKSVPGEATLTGFTPDVDMSQELSAVMLSNFLARTVTCCVFESRLHHLIQEMSTPLTGTVRVLVAPMRDALARVGASRTGMAHASVRGPPLRGLLLVPRRQHFAFDRRVVQRRKVFAEFGDVVIETV